jgi:phosphatidylinositol-3-phosphatase
MVAMAVSVLATVCLPGVAAAASPIRHVFVIILENKSASTTFGANSPAPYLSKTLPSEGAYLPNYYGIGHPSLPNYIAMISGQAPNATTQRNCPSFTNFVAGPVGAYGQVQGDGCVFPASVPTVASQLTAAGLSWGTYQQDMGANPAREPAVCAHPAIGAPDNTHGATPTDQYATRHNPFVYFHSIIDDTALCDTHVVNLDRLPQALTSYSATPNYVFITPDLCNDSHDEPCVNGDPGGLVQADQFLRAWVPQVTGSAAFRQDGLLIITFDEALGSDTTSCCGEIPGPNSAKPGVNGPGGGQVGAVLLSPCIAGGTVTQTAYNHYSMLRSVEDIFGLAHIGYAQLPGQSSFGADIFNRACGLGPPTVSVHSPQLQSSTGTNARIPVRWHPHSGGAASYTVRVRDTSVAKPTWRTLTEGTAATSLTFHSALGHTYTFEVQAVNLAGQAGAWSAGSTTVVPSGARPAKAKFSRGWRVHRIRGAWQDRAIISTRRGATFRLHFRGGSLWLIGERTKAGGAARVTVAGRSRTIRLGASGRRTRQVIYHAKLRARAHRLTVSVLRGTVALEGVAIHSRR